jgi:hypothetical protein
MHCSWLLALQQGYTYTAHVNTMHLVSVVNLCIDTASVQNSLCLPRHLENNRTQLAGGVLHAMPDCPTAHVTAKRQRGKIGSRAVVGTLAGTLVCQSLLAACAS